MARLMWAYNIPHAYRDGKRINIDPLDIKLTFTAATNPFEASFQGRNQKKQDIIEREWKTVCEDTAEILEEIRPKKTM